MEIGRKLNKLYYWEYFWITIILITTILIHVSIISSPRRPIFDEIHYVKEAQTIISKNYDLHPEHPPLGKLFIVAGIKIFGDNPIGWRFFSVFFGSCILLLFYLICRKLGISRTSSSLVAFILGFENLTFVQSSVAMLDVFLYAFILFTFLTYLYSNYILTGVLTGISSLIKLNGVFAIPTIFIHWILTKTKKIIKSLIIIIVAPLTFIILFPVFDFFVYHKFVSPIIRIKEILSLSGSLTFSNTTHEYLSKPWEWVLTYNPIPYSFRPRYIGAVNFSIWILIIPIFIYLIYKSLKKDNSAIFGLSWFFSLYLIWIPMTLITDRVTYLYYIYPAIGSICLGLGILFDDFINIYFKRYKYSWIVILIIILYVFYHFFSFIRLSTFFEII